MNLIEAHVLDAIRNYHKISLQHVRKVLQYIGNKFPSKHPLADYQFQTDGVSLFVEQFGQLINASSKGQLEIERLLKGYLHRIERNPDGLAVRLNLFTRKRDIDEPNIVIVDPSVSFGRPVLRGTGIPTSIIAERYKAGESIKKLARDYGQETLKIEEAIRCELPLQAA